MDFCFLRSVGNLTKAKALHLNDNTQQYTHKTKMPDTQKTKMSKDPWQFPAAMSFSMPLRKEEAGTGVPSEENAHHQTAGQGG